MDDERFLRAILGAPEDDAPRLIYADWLEEHGRPERADYIRIECEQAAIRDEPGPAPNPWDSPRYWELERRRSDLYDRYASEWFAPSVPALRGEMSTRRGFPWHISVTARKFIEQGEAIFRAAPTIEDVMIDRLGRNMSRLAACPALRHVRQLCFFETPFRAPEAVQFAGSPYLENLRQLEIGFTDTQVGPDGAVALARAGGLRNLARLDVHNHAIHNTGATALLRSQHLTALTELKLGVNVLSDWTAAALHDARHLRLKSVDLSGNLLTHRGVTALARADALEGLRELTLSENHLGVRGAASLAGARFVSRLQRLRASGCGLDDQAAAVLCGAPWEALTELSLAANALADEGVRALVGNASLARLSELAIGRCAISPPVAAVVGQVSLAGLRTLKAGHNPLGSEGVRALLAGPLVGPVSHLDLEETELGDSGVAVLAGSPTVANVRWLQLAANHITDAGAFALADSPHLAGVRSLDLRRNEIGPAGKDALTRQFGKGVRV